MILKPLHFGASDYDWRALIGVVLQGVSVAGGIVLANAQHMSSRILTGTVIVLAVVGGLGSVMTALGKPIVRETPQDDT
jgi:flagellar motor component MotA